MKFKYIDSIRGLAILAVIIVHTGQCGLNDYPPLIKSIIKNGARGVQLFYLASAFTLFISYYNRLGVEKNPNKNFFIRRYFRIAPMYYLGIIYYFIQDALDATYPLGENNIKTFANIISNITFTHGFSPYWINSLVPGGWSISVEMTFYVLLPILFRKLKDLNSAVGFTLFSLVFSILLIKIIEGYPLVSDETLWKEYLFFFFPNQLSTFGLGIIAYFVIIKKEIDISALNMLFIALLIISHCIWKYIPSHFFFGLGFLALLIALSKVQYPILVNNFIIYMGKISFSAYLIHFAVLHQLTKLDLVDLISVEDDLTSFLNYFFRLVLTIFFTSIISYLFYVIIEIPFQKIGSKLIYINEK